MEDSPAISVRGLSKKYRLYGSARERLKETLHPFNKQYHREFWALQDISFDVPKGQTLGIIGRNGSGKSTLLEIICSILRPTSGDVQVNGRVSALLELGAGFNPQFTGRDNVIFNAQLMGLSTTEIRGRLPEIEAFADIGEFIDQPVKIYSSGMFVRLAFAAAINVDPDILLVDEALAVGDVRFQYKCYQKFHKFQEQGKTILFISHDLEAVVRHCGQAVLLDSGRIVVAGEPKAATDRYQELLFAGGRRGYAAQPLVLEESYQGYQIVHYRLRYYAIRASADAMDLLAGAEDRLEQHIADKTCLVGASEEQLKRMVERAGAREGGGPTDGGDGTQGARAPRAPEPSELDSFLHEIRDTDNCPTRRSYNKNEHRDGQKRAEILDYLVICNDACDPTAVCSGDWIDVYVKALFHDDTALPGFGVAVRTIDGVMIYGTNTLLSGIKLPKADSGSVVIGRWSIKLDANAGDVFMDLGVGETISGMMQPLDRRMGIVHLSVKSEQRFTGFAMMQTRFEELDRR